MEIMDLNSEFDLSFNQLMSGPVGALVLAVLLIYFTEITINTGFESFFGSIVWGMILGGVTFVLVIFLTRLPFSKSLRDICKQLVPIFQGFPLWKIITLSLAAGLGEELLFRGFLQQWLMTYMSMEVAILLASLGFGLLHFFSFSYFALTTVLGVIFGITYVETNSLLLVMSWHAIYDVLVIGVFSYRPKLLLLE